jgi:hypothetical protein
MLRRIRSLFSYPLTNGLYLTYVLVCGIVLAISVEPGFRSPLARAPVIHHLCLQAAASIHAANTSRTNIITMTSTVITVAPAAVAPPFAGLLTELETPTAISTATAGTRTSASAQIADSARFKEEKQPCGNAMR